MIKYRRRLFYLYLKIWFSKPVQNACVFPQHLTLEFWDETGGFYCSTLVLVCFENPVIYYFPVLDFQPIYERRRVL